ncbi:YceI family protein [Rhodanobacter sp. L36]|uniref:YceI family protein n=1 Tax=Rhodanobacter sp. L36 TaxID=1747221 RepID=UPI00131E8FBA|nr:YceI family protein [Rhodanobacter sp. L36]
MATRKIAPAAFVALLVATHAVFAAQIQHASEDASAVAQYKQLHLSKNPMAADAGEYKLDPHHTSVTVKLAHMDLSRYTLRFNRVNGGFRFDPSLSSASNLKISIDPASVDTGDQMFDKRIAQKYFESAKYPVITFASATAKIVGGQATVDGVLDFHGVKKPVTLKVTYRGSTQSRMGFSGEATFKRSEFGVSEWVPLEADEVTILVETELVKA